MGEDIHDAKTGSYRARVLCARLVGEILCAQIFFLVCFSARSPSRTTQPIFTINASNVQVSALVGRLEMFSQNTQDSSIVHVFIRPALNIHVTVLINSN